MLLFFGIIKLLRPRSKQVIILLISLILLRGLSNFRLREKIRYLKAEIPTPITSSAVLKLNFLFVFSSNLNDGMSRIFNAERK